MGWSEIVIYCWLENYLQDSISIELQINGFDHDSKQTIYTTTSFILFFIQYSKKVSDTQCMK